MKLTEQIIPIALYYEDVTMRKLSNADVKKLKDLLKVVYANLEAAEQEKLSPPKEARARAKVRADQKPNNARVKARNLNSLATFVRPIFRRSLSLIVATSNQSAA
jgi:hypothetical protein